MRKPSKIPTLALSLLAVSLLAGGCKKDDKGAKEQSFEDAVTIMCTAPDRVKDAPADQKAAKLAAEMAAGVTNKEALDVFKGIGLDKTADAKKTRLMSAAKKAGLASCATADVWTAPPVAAGGPGTTTEHGSGKGAGEGPGEKAGAAGNKDGKPGGASKEHGSGTGGGAGPGEKAGAAGNKDGKPGN